MTPRLRAHPELDLFNGPDRNASTAHRTSASITPQALFLLNSPFIAGISRSFGDRMSGVGSDDDGIQLGFQLTVGRDPDVDERAYLRDFLSSYRTKAAASSELSASIAWTALAKVLLGSNEFFFLP